jgi:hypothetical protein
MLDGCLGQGACEPARELRAGTGRGDRQKVALCHRNHLDVLEQLARAVATFVSALTFVATTGVLITFASVSRLRARSLDSRRMLSLATEPSQSETGLMTTKAVASYAVSDRDRIRMLARTQTRTAAAMSRRPPRMASTYWKIPPASAAALIHVASVAAQFLPRIRAQVHAQRPFPASARFRRATMRRVPVRFDVLPGCVAV